MGSLKKILPFLCLPIAVWSLWAMTQIPNIAIWQVAGYSLVIVVPCILILCWRRFDLYFGLAPSQASLSERWNSITPWVGWMILTAMILLNHFARPPA